MKIASTNVVLESEGQIQKSEFNIGDPWLLLEYMTNQVYSDKPRVIVQEIISNSRDAHREVKQKRKVRVRLPNRFDPTIEFRDWGPGISPERMHSVYKSYGMSTKRGSNEQTGGFGIGGKTPWAYVNAFNIRVIANEDNKLVLREYTAVKGEDRSLQLLEMGSPVIIDPLDPSTHEDDKHTGTAISFIVKREDFDDFARNLMVVTEFWTEEEKPEIVSSNELKYSVRKSLISGNGWEISSITVMSKGFEHSGQHETLILIDGIPYPASSQALGLQYNSVQSNILQENMILSFGVGELSLALSRESLQYDERTKKAIIKRLTDIHDDMTKLVEDKLKNCLTRVDACILFQELKKTFNVARHITKPMWNGVDVSQEYIQFINNQVTVRKYKKDSDGIRSEKSNYIPIKHACKLVVQDLPERSILRIMTIFAENPTIQELCVLQPTSDPKACPALGVKTEPNTYKNYEDWKKINRLEDFSPILLSTVQKFKRVKNADGTLTTLSGGRTTIKAYLFTGNRSTNTNMMWDPHDDCDISEGEGIYAVIDRGIVQNKLSNVSLCSSLYDIMKIVGNPPLIGIPVRFAEKMGPGWKKLQVYLNERVKELEAKIDFQVIATYNENKAHTLSTLMTNSSIINRMMLPTFSSLITDPTSPIARYISMCSDVQNAVSPITPEYTLYKRMISLFGIQENIPAVNKDMATLKALVQEKYSLIFNTQPSSFEKCEKELIIYINAKNVVLTNEAVPVI
jgi:hypothetical protein